MGIKAEIYNISKANAIKYKMYYIKTIRGIYFRNMRVDQY